ncbi:MAG TPA: hypothetical protein VFT70_04160 [Nocardioides sp.]|nr:hypothetical protein [Nocardioides sp.]
MRSTQLITGAMAVVATTALTGFGGAAQADEPTTTHERGIVIECTGTIDGRAVYASLYENRTFGNEIQVLVGDDNHQVGGSRQDPDGFLRKGRVRGTMTVGGDRAVVKGTAHRVGDRIPVSEEYDDAGQHITTTGVHRSLDTGLRLVWRGDTAPLQCDTAFAYRLKVVKESTV